LSISTTGGFSRTQLHVVSHSLKISAHKTNTMAFHKKDLVRFKIVLDDRIVEQASYFNYLGCNIIYN
jgi:hypothetical protein